MASSIVTSVETLRFPWQTVDPFLFCVYHVDNYPAGRPDMGPNASLAGRNLGQDFGNLNGWNMYHGKEIPGFPRHPHRGFETITFTRKGLIDHSDSLGATARFGNGDVQWMTAGRGVEHCEMFPLVEQERGNPTEFFQIWLNLPARNKMAPPHFAMFWSHQIPEQTFHDQQGGTTHLVMAAGALDGTTAPAPPPASWAAEAANGVAIWTITLSPGAQWTIPAGAEGLSRSLYLFEGAVTLGGAPLSGRVRATVPSHLPCTIENGAAPAQLLMLQGRPIGEPVAAHGPFVMNNYAELQRAFEDYQRGLFGRWPWPGSGPVHARDAARFAIHADGRRESAAAARDTAGQP